MHSENPANRIAAPLSPPAPLAVALSAPLTASEILEYARLLFQKCDLEVSHATYRKALAAARLEGNDDVALEAVTGLLRLAAEADDREEIALRDRELDETLPKASDRALIQALYNKGIVASYQDDFRRARRFFLQGLRVGRRLLALDPADRAVRTEYAKIWANIATNLFYEDRAGLSEALVRELLRRFEAEELQNINGQLYMLCGHIEENKRQFGNAFAWFQKAHVAYLQDRNWFAHLYVLHAYARLERKQRNFAQAYWYLDLIDKASKSPRFGNLRHYLQLERDALAGDAIDILIDSRKCEVSTRETKGVSLGKQYILLGILEALTDAHGRNEPDSERGLSKAEIIEKVWREKYRPEAHDNKLYYNINRLRKLIEPDMKHPKYLLNWKEGYRLAPEMKVHFVGGNRKGRALS